MPYSQTDRILEIQSPLGADALMLVELDGEERISEPYVFKIRFVTEANITPTGICSARRSRSSSAIPRAPSPTGRRKLHGLVRKLRRGAGDRSGMAEEWYAEVVPHLWFLSRTSDCRIFQEKSIPDIVKEVLQMHGVTAIDDRLMGTYEPRDYVVQYRESALDFVQRLMEQEGIFYWHEHTRIAAHAGARRQQQRRARTCPIGAVRRSSAPTAARCRCRAWMTKSVVRSGKWTVRDFNFDTPSTLLEVTAADHGRDRRDGQPRTLRLPRASSRRTATGGPSPSTASRTRRRSTWSVAARARSQLLQRRHDVRGRRAADAGRFLLTEVHHHAEDYSHWTMESWGREPRDPIYANELRLHPQDASRSGPSA